jgi:hypothetical protein
VGFRDDYKTAKTYFETITRKYADLILPTNISLKIQFGDLKRQTTDPVEKRAVAWAYGNSDWSKSMLVFDTNLIKSNVHNIKSKFFDALSIHEICHVWHGEQEPGIDGRYSHTRPLYYYCFEHFPFSEPWMASPVTHPDRYSLRAYLGSDDKVVPNSISKMIFYSCKDCGRGALWNLYQQGSRPTICEKCESPNIIWTLLKPFDTYRVAVANSIDTVDASVPARYFVYDREEL